MSKPAKGPSGVAAHPRVTEGNRGHQGLRRATRQARPDEGAERLGVDSWALGRRSHVVQTPLIDALMADPAVDLRAVVSDANVHLEELRAMPVPVLVMPAASGLAGAIGLSLRMWPARHRLARDGDMRGRLVHVAMTSPWDLLYLPVAKRAGARILLTVHDAERHPGEESRVFQAMTDRVIELSDDIAVLSNHVGDALAKRWPAKPIHVVPGGLATIGGPPTAARPFPRDRPLRLLFFGRIVRYKGLDLLLDAVRLLRAAGANVELTVAGSGDLAPYADRLAGLDGVTVQQAWISDGEKARLFAQCDVNVLPYREASQSGNALDGLRAAMPTVATRLGGLTEQLTDGLDTLFADAATPASIAGALGRLIADPPLYERLSAGASASAKALDPAGVAGAWTTLYRDLLSGHGG